jgi:acyl carrier protein
MEINKFVENFIAALELEDAADINAQTDFKALDEWDSLASLTVISMVDDAYGVTINNKDVRACDTLEDLFNMVMGKK